MDEPRRSSCPHDFLIGDEGDASGPATDLADALGALDEPGSADKLLDLLAGDKDQRRWAAHVARRLNRPEDTGVLLTLARDREPEVRAEAASGLAFLVATGRSDAIVVNGCNDACVIPGY